MVYREVKKIHQLNFRHAGLIYAEVNGVLLFLKITHLGKKSTEKTHTQNAKINKNLEKHKNILEDQSITSLVAKGNGRKCSHTNTPHHKHHSDTLQQVPQKQRAVVACCSEACAVR